MEKVFKRNQLPNFQKIEHLHFDIQKLREDFEKTKFELKSVFEANGALSSLHQKLANQLAYGNNYKEVCLTDFAGETNLKASPGDKLSVREKLAFKNLTSPLNEHMYNLPTNNFKSTYFYSRLNTFKSPVTRVRIASLGAGSEVDWHIDYDPSYAVRLIIPIISGPKVQYLVNRRGVIETKQLPADGSAWFINTGFPHRVENAGLEARVVLLVSINGQKDIAPYSIPDSI